MERFEKLIAQGVREYYSDVHMTGGHPLVFRRNGVIDFQKEVKWSHEEIDDLVEELLTPRERQLLQVYQAVDIGRSINMVRVRVNVFNTTRGLSLAVRLLPGMVPEIGSLNLHPSLRDFAHRKNGLFLICGATGCGKSTTMAAMIEEINRTRSAHIVTLEDPVEYRFKSKKSFIEQRELGTHFPTFDRGLYDVLREDPDVILVGELRDPETIRLTLNAVESGHMVIASLHATNSEDAVYRIGNSFAQEAQDIVRHQLASTLAVLIVQTLSFLPRVGFRVPVLSIMTGSSAVKGMIRENRLAQIESTMQTSRKDGMMTMEQYQQEFVDQRQFFTLPEENFRPSTEITTEIIYTSRLMKDREAMVRSAVAAQAEARAARPVPEKPSPVSTLPSQLIARTPFPLSPAEQSLASAGALPETQPQEGSSFYVLTEEKPIHELIAEMKKLEH
ncbi:MAG: PilT/PilU family type 4a pilus ATPase [Thermodesulfobacteriota bacterium]